MIYFSYLLDIIRKIRLCAFLFFLWCSNERVQNKKESSINEKGRSIGTLSRWMRDWISLVSCQELE